MPFIELTGLGNVAEPKPVDSGMYKLTILSAELTTAGQDSKPLIQVRIGLDEYPDSPPVRESLWLPREGDAPESANFKLLRIKRFCHLFNLPYDSNGFNIDDWPGAATVGQVRLGEPNDRGDQYNELVLPKVKDERTPEAGKSATKRRSA